MLDCFQKIVKNEGFSRLYRGISAPILMEAPKRYIIAIIYTELNVSLLTLSQSHQVRGK